MTYVVGFLREAWARLRTSGVSTVLAMLVVVAGTVGIFATTGSGIAGQQRALSVLNTPEGRLITVVDSEGTAGLDPSSVATIESLPAVEWVIGLGPARDMSNSHLPDAGIVPSRTLHGSLPPGIRSSVGEIPEGRALMGADAAPVGMPASGGPMEHADAETVVIGTFEAASPLEMLNDSVLRRPAQGERTQPLRTILISCTDVAQLEAVSSAVRGLVSASQPEVLEVQVSAELGGIGGEVVQELASSSRLLLVSLLGLTGVLIGAVQFGRVAAMAKDIGRLRALGATRTLIVCLTLTMTVLPSLAGASLGAAIGSVVVWRIAGAPPGLAFALSVVALMVLASLAGTIPPALRAAFTDPVKILRVP